MAGDDEVSSTKRQKKLLATIRRKQFVPPGDWVESTKDVILSSILVDGNQLIKKDDSYSVSICFLLLLCSLLIHQTKCFPLLLSASVLKLTGKFATLS